jgi:hypothetical protein
MAPGVRRRRLILVLAFCAFFVLAVGFLLARAFGATSTERAEVLALVRAEAAGDAAAVLRALPACAAEPACAAITRERVAALRRPGRVELLAYEPSVRFPLTEQTGTARVAWRAGRGLPVVQCVRVHRQGPLSGAAVELLAVSAPIGPETECPA